MEQNQQPLYKKILTSNTLYKGLGAAIVVFFGLTYKISPVDQPLDYVVLYDQFVTKQFDVLREQPGVFPDAQLKETIDSILEPTFHEAGDASPDDDFWLVKLEDVCKEYSLYCERISYEGAWSNKGKYMYTAIAVFFMANIDMKLQREDNLSSRLQLLTLRQREDKARGYASHTKVFLHIPMIKTMEEFVGVLVHELGHVIDIGVIEGSGKEMDKKFTEFNKVTFHKNDFSLGFYELSRQSETVRKPGADELGFCSGYGMSNTFEDFSECFKLYLLNHNYFFVLAQSDPVMYKKYQYMANLFDGDYIQTRSSDVTLAKSHITKKKRAWDSTKLQ